LDRFLAGNPHALALVRVPTVEQERARTQTRIRQSLCRDLKVLAQRGRGIALQYGYRLKGPWYGVRNWPKLAVPDWLHTLLAPLQAALATLHQTGARANADHPVRQHRTASARLGRLEPADH